MAVMTHGDEEAIRKVMIAYRESLSLSIISAVSVIFERGTRLKICMNRLCRFFNEEYVHVAIMRESTLYYRHESTNNPN